MKKFKNILLLVFVFIMINSVCFANPIMVGPRSYFVFSGNYFIPSIVGVILSTIFLILILYSTILMLKKAIDLEHYPNNLKKYKILKTLLIIIFALLYAFSMYVFFRNMRYMY